MKINVTLSVKIVFYLLFCIISNLIFGTFYHGIILISVLEIIDQIKKDHFISTYTFWNIGFIIIICLDGIISKDVIIEDILLHRALEQKKNILEEIKENERLLAEEREKDMDDRDSDFMTNALRTIVQLRGTSEAYTKEINEIKKTKDGKFKDLKATRNERLKTVEESGKNIFALIKLLDEQKMRETEGRMTGLVYEASKTKEGQMKQNMVFADGEVDRVWLTPEAELEDEQKD